MFLDDEQDPLLDEEIEEEEYLDPDDESFLEEEEEELEELDVDDRGHVRPRRRSRDEELEEEIEY